MGINGTIIEDITTIFCLAQLYRRCEIKCWLCGYAVSAESEKNSANPSELQVLQGINKKNVFDPGKDWTYVLPTELRG